MADRCSENRRAFLKASAASAATLAAAGLFPRAVSAKQGAWTGPKMPINGKIDNLRVVSCKDPKMLTNPKTVNSFKDIDANVNAQAVFANLDAMAIELAKSAALPNPTAAQAWSTIFQRPEKHEFKDAIVAIKVNTNNAFVIPCTAILNKLALELHNVGVPYGNIIVYDGCTSALAKYVYTGSTINPEIKVSDGNSLLHASAPNDVQIQAPVPAPYKTTGGTELCTPDVANGVVDILINVGTNKGNGALFGEVSLSMKNHYGTFKPVHEYNFLIGISKSDAILGGTPPRQQLAIIDSLTSVSVMDPTGPIDVADKWPKRLVMGTFSPAVDYLTVKKVRREEMGIKALPNSFADDFLIQFGYSAQEREAMQMIEVPPGSTKASYPAKGEPVTDAVSFHVNGNNVRSTVVAVSFPSSENIERVTVFQMNGRLVRTIPVSNKFTNSRIIGWDGKTNTGADVNAGSYVVLVTGEKSERSEKFTLWK
jgi:hypothetical protein